MTTLGHELKQRGHDVTLVGLLDAHNKALAAGLNFEPIGIEDFPVGTTKASLEKLGELSGLKAFRYTVELFRQQTQVLLRDTPDAFQRAGVDFLLIDQSSFGGSTIAQCLDLPFISVSCALMLNRDPNVPPIMTSWGFSDTIWARWRNQIGYQLLTQAVKPIREVLNDFRAAKGLPVEEKVNDGFSTLAQLSQQPVEFEFPRLNLPNCFHFTGPYSNPMSRESIHFPFEQLTGEPLIYASLGTVQNRLGPIFQAIAEACLPLDAQLVISLGGGMPIEALPDLPGSPITVAYAPQLELLSRASLTITHAGLNTTLESLSYGVPMVAMPIANDQPGVAARIAWSGTGEVVSIDRLSVSKLRSAIRRVLSEESYKKNALRLRDSIKQAGGVKKAANIIEQVFTTGEPCIGC
jgi:MGT family glycosyltransferase